MAFTRRDLYSAPANNISNMAVNIDDLRIGNDRFNIDKFSVGFYVFNVYGYIEVNGSGYYSDSPVSVDFTANPTHKYITATDVSGSLVLGTSATKGTYDEFKKGFYLPGGQTKVLNCFVDTANFFYTVRDLRKAYSMARQDLAVTTITTTPRILDYTAYIDMGESLTGSASALFVAPINNWYNIEFISVFNAGTYAPVITIRRTGTSDAYSFVQDVSGTAFSTINCNCSLYLDQGDTIEVEVVASSGSGSFNTSLGIVYARQLMVVGL